MTIDLINPQSRTLLAKRRWRCRAASALALTLTLALAGVGSASAQTREGVDVGKNSAFSNLVPADQVERSSAEQYIQMMQKASEQGALAGPEHPQLKRLRTMAAKIIPPALQCTCTRVYATICGDTMYLAVPGNATHPWLLLTISHVKSP